MQQLSTPQRITDLVLDDLLKTNPEFGGVVGVLKDKFAKYQRWLNLFNVEWQDGDKCGNYQFASRRKSPVLGAVDKPDAVIIVPVHVSKKGVRRLVMIDEFRIPIGVVETGFPAGCRDGDEDAETTARRELREETGFEVTKILHTTAPIYSSAGMTDESVAIVFVECEGEVSNAGLEESEKIDVRLESMTGVKQLLAASKDPKQKIHIGAKAYPVLLMFQRAGTFEGNPTKSVNAGPHKRTLKKAAKKTSKR